MTAQTLHNDHFLAVVLDVLVGSRLESALLHFRTLFGPPLFCYLGVFGLETGSDPFLLLRQAISGKYRGYSFILPSLLGVGVRCECTLVLLLQHVLSLLLVELLFGCRVTSVVFEQFSSVVLGQGSRDLVYLRLEGQIAVDFLGFYFTDHFVLPAVLHVQANHLVLQRLLAASRVTLDNDFGSQIDLRLERAAQGSLCRYVLLLLHLTLLESRLSIVEVLH